MTSYNMDTTCWPHGLHMVVQGRVHSSQHGPSVGLYKVDQFVEEFSIEFSCVSLIQELFLFPTLRNKFIASSPSILSYGNNQMTIASFWDRTHHTLSIFGTQEISTTDTANITQSITRMIDYFKHNPADKKPPAGEFADVVKALQGLIAIIYTSRQDFLPIEDKSICKLVGEKIVPGYMKLRLSNDKTAEDSSSPSISLPSNTAVPPPTTNPITTPPFPTSIVPQKIPKPSNMKKSYAQASKTNLSSKTEDIL